MLDIDLIVRRRHELGLSQRHVARQLGVTPVTVVALENGTNHGDLPLRLIARLADALACDITDLVDRPRPHGDDRDDPDDGDPVAKVGSLLASTDGVVAVETLADSIGGTLARTTELLDELDQRLRSCGLRLHRARAGVQLVADPAHRQPAALQQLLRGQQARQGLTVTEATLLYRALNGTLEPGNLTNAEQVAYARLVNADLIAMCRHPGDDVEFSIHAEARAS